MTRGLTSPDLPAVLVVRAGRAAGGMPVAGSSAVVPADGSVGVW